MIPRLEIEGGERIIRDSPSGLTLSVSKNYLERTEQIGREFYVIRGHDVVTFGMGKKSCFRKI